MCATNSQSLLGMQGIGFAWENQVRRVCDLWWKLHNTSTVRMNSFRCLTSELTSLLRVFMWWCWNFVFCFRMKILGVTSWSCSSQMPQWCNSSTFERERERERKCMCVWLCMYVCVCVCVRMGIPQCGEGWRGAKCDVLVCHGIVMCVQVHAYGYVCA